MTPHYYILYKPFGMLSQFTSPHANKKTLKDIQFPFPRDVYPVGRLDEDSEGLLFLTNDKPLNFRILNPSFKHQRTYWAQVDGEITEEACKELSKGMDITIEQKKYHTLPAIVKKMDPPNIPERLPPVRYRKSIPTSWISLTLEEGKNRQVRKMTAAAGFPTLRLIRISIEDLSLEGMQPGELRVLDRVSVYKNLHLPAGT